jgi:protein SCO1
MTRASIIAALLSLWLAACSGGDAVRFNAVDITGTQYGANLRLTDIDGKPRAMGDFRGNAVAVFFGFTQCPDVCPTGLAVLADVTKRLGSDGERLQVVFVTLDPERDKPEVLKAYMAAFNPRFIALRGSVEETAAAAKDFNVFFEKQGDVASGKYTLNHTAAFFIFDPQGRARLFVRHGETAERIVADVKVLLSGR